MRPSHGPSVLEVLTQSPGLTRAADRRQYAQLLRGAIERSLQRGEVAPPRPLPRPSPRRTPLPRRGG